MLIADKNNPNPITAQFPMCFESTKMIQSYYKLGKYETILSSLRQSHFQTKISVAKNETLRAG